MDISVDAADGGWVCEVALEAAGERSRYTVRVSPADLRRWGRGNDANAAAVQELVRRSFQFLLEREPPGAILRRFDLSVIQRYFPEYDQALRA
jgi:hypothetical protein